MAVTSFIDVQTRQPDNKSGQQYNFHRDLFVDNGLIFIDVEITQKKKSNNTTLVRFTDFFVKPFQG